MSHHKYRLFAWAALALLLVLFVLTGTQASAQGPSGSEPWRGPSDGAVATYDNPNTPENLKQITASSNPVRVIIQLQDAPLTQYQGGGATRLARPQRDARGKINLNSAEATAYVNYLTQQQATFTRSLAAAVSSANVQYQYQLAFNGVAARVPGNAIPAIQKMAGVQAVTVERRFEPQMDASLQLIGLYSGMEDTGTDQGMWAQVGGHDKAGTGIKIADVDTGIDQTHPFFNPAGFTYPEGFPKGNTGYTTPKVIAARVYIRPDQPPDMVKDCACPQDHLGHGSHTAGTMAGRFGTTTSFGVKDSGIAPQAWLMNYKVFYRDVYGNETASTPELLMAAEDVIRDGADVVNNSWGGTALSPVEPEILAFNAVMDAGITVIFSAGNNGQGANSIGSPGIGARFISVGASTTNRLFYHSVSVPGGDASVTNLMGAISSGPWFSTDVGPAPYVDSAALGNLLGCNPGFPAGSMTGKIALIKRGTCTFAEKVINAKNAGAIAVVVWNNIPGVPTAMGALDATTIPSVMVSNADGPALQAWLTAHPAAQLKIGGPISRITNDAWQDTIASFSSKGPSLGYGIKPDLVAPGVNILSSVPYGTKWDTMQGTSMAAPHVTGVAALVKQAHPTWTPEQVKSAIVNTAVLPAALDPSCKDYFGTAYPGPQCRGAGRLNAGYPAGPGDPGLVFDKPTVGLGAQFPGATIPVTMTANAVTLPGTYSVVISQSVTSPNLTITPSATSLTFAANELKPFTVTFNIGAATAAKDYYGMIQLVHSDGVHKLNIPYWVRVLAPWTITPGASVLLIDDDMSNLGATDYRSYYTAALTALGVTYDVFETDYNTCASPWEIASKYPKAVLFTGANGYGAYWTACDYGIGYTNNLGSTVGNLTGTNIYLTSGGRLLVFAQSSAYRLAVPAGRDNENKLYFGAHYVQNNVFGTTNLPKPSARGVGDWSPYLKNLKVDLSAGGDGAANQTSVDELDAMFYSDIDTLPTFTAVSTSTLSSGLVGTRTSSEPTIESVTQNPRTPWQPLGYRTELVSFGLEGVNNNTGFATREELLARLLGFLDDTVSVQFTQPAYLAAGPGSPATLTANATMSITHTGTLNNAIQYYRWDFGDGTATQTTGTNTAYHAYAKNGFYNAYVEVMDAFGHRAVAGPVRVVVGNYFYFPYIPK